MNTMRYALLGLVLAGFALILRADPPQESGKVLLLANDRTMEGDIERLGERYRIRRNGGEVWVPVGDGVILCTDWNDALKRVAARANLLDPDERLRLARWCHQNALPAQALNQVKEALAIRPQDAKAKQLQKVLERALENATNRDPTTTVARPVIPTAPNVDVSSDCLTLFAQKVQPILLNTCGQCHHSGKGGDFQLSKTFEGGQRLATQRNLAVVLSQINTQKPELSPLLIKALSDHGHAGQAPIKGRQAVPYQTLQAWVELALTNNPHLKQQALAAPKTASPPPVVSQPAPAAPADPGTGDFASGPLPVRDPAPAVSPARPEPEPADPFDPALFNRPNGPK